MFMIYLDYSDTTKTSKRVIDRFVYVSDKFFANPNSGHKFGKECKSDEVASDFLRANKKIA